MRRFRRLSRFLGRRMGHIGPPWIGRRLIRRLRSAHRLRELQRFDEAAGTFAELARLAWPMAPSRAALLAIEAGLAYLLSGDVGRGRSHLEEGLSWLRANAPASRTTGVADRARDELRAAGLAEEVDRLEGFASGPRPSPSPDPRLPSKCPYCGGGLGPAELEWSDDRQPMCGYCGSVVRAEG